MSRVRESSVLSEQQVALLLDDLGGFSLERIRLIDGIIASSGVVDLIEKWHSEDALARHAGGRPPIANSRAVLVLLFLLALDNRALHLTTMARIVSQRLDAETLDYLGLPLPDDDVDRWHDRLLSALHRVLRVIDPFPSPDRRSRTPREDYEALRDARDPREVAVRQERLNLVMNSILEATWKTLPREVRKQWKGNTAVDATLYKAFSKSYKKEGHYVPVEPDAGVWARAGDHAPKEEDGRRERSEYQYGWDAHLVVTLPNRPENEDELFPCIALGMGLDKPGFKVAENTVGIYESLHRRGHLAGYIIGDRAYFAGQTAEKFHLPLAALGYQPVTTYRKSQIEDGLQGSDQGAILVDGQFLCPDVLRTNPGLVKATFEYEHGGPKTEATLRAWTSRRKEIQRWAAKPHGRPDRDGFQRFTHPKRPDGKHVCDPNRPDAGTFCTQGSITIAPTTLTKLRQPLVVGSTKWLALHGAGRSAVESFNGLLKDEAKQAFGTPSRRRVRGYAAQSLIASLLTAAANMRAISKFFAKVRARDASAAAPKTRARRRLYEMTLDRWKQGEPLVTNWDDDPPERT